MKILAANTHCKYFLKIAEHCQYCNEYSFKSSQFVACGQEETNIYGENNRHIFANFCVQTHK
jgi:hypothetical protein